MCLEEKSTAAKLDMLYRKSLYLIALNLASTQGLDVSSVADIHKQYGDHLYGKGDYDGAMQQYVQTIGHLQPSYVVRKVSSSKLYTDSYPKIRKLLVSRCSTNPQSRHLPPRTTLPRTRQRRPHHAPAKHLHQTQGRCAPGQLHQDRVAAARRP
jgi:hypothetical protein